MVTFPEQFIFAEELSFCLLGRMKFWDSPLPSENETQYNEVLATVQNLDSGLHDSSRVKLT
jgi:hypothetical protein